MFDTVRAHAPASLHEARWPLATLSIAIFTVSMDNTILNVALPSIAWDLSADTTGLQWVVTAYSLMFGGLLMTAGSLGDRLGRRRVLLLGLTAMAACSVLAPLVGDVWQLVALRAAIGAAAAFVMPSTLAILSVLFEEPLRTRALGLVGSVGAVAFVVGPILAGWLLEHGPWTWVILLNVPLAALALALALIVVPESRQRTTRPADLPGAALSVSFMTVLIWGLNRGAALGWASAQCRWGLLTSAVLLAGFVVRQSTARHPMLDLSLVRRRAFVGPAVAEGTVLFALSALLFLLTQHMQLVLGWSPLQAGLAGLPLIVAMGLAQLLVDALERYPRAFATLVGMATLAAGLAAVAIWLDRGYVAIAAGYVLCGIGLRIVMQTVAVAILDALPRADAGLASALGDTLQEIGAALGVAAVATLLTAALGSTPVLSSPVVFEDTMRQGLLWCSALVLAAGAFAAWALRGVEPAETVAVPADRSGQAA